jgi:hypothetical protein
MRWFTGVAVCQTSPDTCEQGGEQELPSRFLKSWFSGSGHVTVAVMPPFEEAPDAFGTPSA